MIQVKERLGAIERVRRKLADRLNSFDPDLTIELARLTNDRANVIRLAMDTEWWAEVQEMLQQTIDSHKNAVYAYADVEGQERAVAYNKAVVEVCKAIKGLHETILSDAETANAEAKRASQPDRASDRQGSHAGLRMIGRRP